VDPILQGRGKLLKADERRTSVASIAVPDLSTTFLVATILPLILGFIVGVIIRSALKIGIAIAIIIILLIAAGIVSPNQVLQPLLSIVKSGPQLVSYAQRVASYLPYSSLTFLIGLAVGLWKG
jgi:uncharacterized membrane protein (Fun14 family)